MSSKTKKFWKKSMKKALFATVEKLQESEKVIQSQKNVISALNKQLEDADTQIEQLSLLVQECKAGINILQLTQEHWQYSDIEVSAPKFGMVKLSYENQEAYVRPGATVKLIPKNGMFSFPPVVVESEQPAQEIGEKIWNVFLTAPEGDTWPYEVLAYTEDGAINIASDLYASKFGRLPHEGELGTVVELSEDVP